MACRTHAALFSLLLLSAYAVAEETATPVITSQVNAEVRVLNAQLDQLEQRLAESERLRSELSSQLESAQSQPESAPLTALRQDNQRLKLQLKTAQAQQPPRLLGEQQQWFAVGGGVAVLAFILGAVARGRRKSRRDWMN